jgi:hypothetical protein
VQSIDANITEEPIRFLPRKELRLFKLAASDPHQVKPLRRAIGYGSAGEASDCLVIGAHKPNELRQHGIDAS